MYAFRMCAFIMCMIFAGYSAVPLRADTDNDAFKKKLDTIKGQVDAINNKLKNLKNEKKSLLNDIYEIELRYEKEIIENNKVKLQLNDTRRKIDKQEGEKKSLEREIDKSKKNLIKIIRILYKLGGNSYLKIFIRVDTIDQLFKNYRLFMTLVEYKSDEINKIKKNISRLNKVKEQLQTEYLNLKTFSDLKEQKIRNISGLKRGKLNLINRINTDKKDYLRLMDELKFEAAQLDKVLSGKKVKSSLRVLDLKRIKGRLQWPIDGKVISSFGKKRSTRFNTYIVDNGIEIRPSGSGRVKAVYSGDVIFADYYKGYGNLVIIQHSRDIRSFYGHCKNILKKKGDPIMTGEEIAIVGDTGSTHGKSLYFEIRNNVKAQDPMKWLRKKR